VRYVAFTSSLNGKSRVRQVGDPVHNTSVVVMENVGTAGPFERAFTYHDNRLLASKCLYFFMSVCLSASIKSAANGQIIVKFVFSDFHGNLSRKS
jgi:hypothetical protein